MNNLQNLQAFPAVFSLIPSNVKKLVLTRGIVAVIFLFSSSSNSTESVFVYTVVYFTLVLSFNLPEKLLCLIQAYCKCCVSKIKSYHLYFSFCIVILLNILALINKLEFVFLVISDCEILQKRIFLQVNLRKRVFLARSNYISEYVIQVFPLLKFQVYKTW